MIFTWKLVYFRSVLKTPCLASAAMVFVSGRGVRVESRRTSGSWRGGGAFGRERGAGGGASEVGADGETVQCLAFRPIEALNLVWLVVSYPPFCSVRAVR